MNPETRLEQLQQLLAEAHERGDVDKITELEANIFHEFSGEHSSGGEQDT
jgi:hypothetical protein